MSERGIYGHIPGCQCTYEEGDSDCAVHPTCTECGVHFTGALLRRFQQYEAVVMALACYDNDDAISRVKVDAITDSGQVQRRYLAHVLNDMFPERKERR